MATDVEICNMALGHLSAGEIADLDERSPEAQACSRFLKSARETTLKAFEWSFAKRIVALGLVESNPTTEWGFSYRYPSDCIFARRILSGTRPEPQDARVPFELASDDDGQLIYTDKAAAQLQYTKREENAERYPEDFSLAMSFKLAALCAKSVTGGDPNQLGTQAESEYMATLAKASLNAAREFEVTQGPDSEFIRARS